MSHPAQHLAVPIRAAAVLDTRASLLFGLPARRRSLLLPIRSRETARREDLLVRYLASLPAGATVTVCQLLREVPGLRLLPSQAGTIAATLRALGWRAGNGFAEFVREGEAPAARRAANLLPEIARRLPAISGFLDSVPQGGTVTERQVAAACGVMLPDDHRRRAIGRQLRRMGWRPVGRGSPLYRREGEA